jgi:hypothetical protein
MAKMIHPLGCPCLVRNSGFRDNEPTSRLFIRDESDRLSSDMRFFLNEGGGQGKIAVSEGRAKVKCTIDRRVNSPILNGRLSVYEDFVSSFRVIRILESQADTSNLDQLEV